MIMSIDNYESYTHVQPKTLEQLYYRNVFVNMFNKYYANVIPYYWMPKFIEADDCSARTLNIYNKVMVKQSNLLYQ